MFNSIFMLYANNIKAGLRPYYHRFQKRKNALLYGSCAVLLYHRVTRLESDPQLLSVSPENFQAHLELLREKYKVLSAEEFSHHFTTGKRFPKKAVFLTFDDGYADNHLEARPILESMQMQALFYISTWFIEHQKEYWWDELEHLLLVPSELPNDLAATEEGVTIYVKRGQTESIHGTYAMLCERLKQLSFEQRENVLQLLRDQLKYPGLRASHRPMSVAELKAFATSASVAIGAHTEHHPSLGYLSAEDQRREILTSADQLEKWLGKRPDYFSYPFGTGADYNETSISICTEAGFKHTAANYPGLVHKKSPRHAFPRFLVRDWNKAEFEKQLHAFFNS